MAPGLEGGKCAPAVAERMLTAQPAGLNVGQAADLALPSGRDELIAYGRCCPTTAPPGWARRS
jgi:hypothetical protein